MASSGWRAMFGRIEDVLERGIQPQLGVAEWCFVIGSTVAVLGAFAASMVLLVRRTEGRYARIVSAAGDSGQTGSGAAV
jgi:hypothetical protein